MDVRDGIQAWNGGQRWQYSDGESSDGTGTGRTGWVTENEKEASVGSIRGDASKSEGTVTGRSGWVME